jgi:hypothetical protein
VIDVVKAGEATMKRIGCVTAVAFAIALSAASGAQPIQKWRTPNGEQYFGDRPPAGSVKIGEYQEAKPRVSEATADAKAKADNAFDAQAIRRRRRIEKGLNEAADQLAAARAQLSRVRIATSLNARRAMQARESEATLRVSEYKQDFESLTEEVRRYYHGDLPPSWSPTPNCRNCP